MKTKLLLLGASIFTVGVLQLKAFQPEPKSEGFRKLGASQELIRKTVEQIAKTVFEKIRTADLKKESERYQVTFRGDVPPRMFADLLAEELKPVLEKPPFNNPEEAVLLMYALVKKFERLRALATGDLNLRHLYTPGRHIFEAIVTPGWSMTRLEDAIEDLTKQLLGQKAADNLQEMMLKERTSQK